MLDRSEIFRYLRLGLACVMLVGAVVWTIDVYGFPGKLRRGINEAIRHHDAVLQLSTVTTFEWDEVSVIPGDGNLGSARECLGFDAPADVVATEDIATLVFVSGRTVARSYRTPRPPFLYPIVPFKPGPCRVSREDARFRVILDENARHLLVFVEPAQRAP